MGFEEGGKADVVEDAVPVEGKLQVAQRALVNLWRKFFVRKENSLGDGYAEFVARAKLKNLSSADHQKGLLMTCVPVRTAFFRERAIEGHVVRDAIDDDRVARGLGHVHAADMDELGADAFDLHRVDPVDEGAGKGIFHSKKNTNLLHVILQLVTDMLGRSLVRDRRV